MFETGIQNTHVERKEGSRDTETSGSRGEE